MSAPPAFSRASRRFPTRRTGVLAALVTMTLGVGACSSSDPDTDYVSQVTQDVTSDLTTGDGQGTWPRTVPSIIVTDSADDANGSDGGGSDGNDGGIGTVTRQVEKVEIPAEPTRIVSTSAPLTAALLTIGAPVVASVGDSSGSTDTDTGGFPDRWSRKAAEASVFPLGSDGADPDAVAAQEPDLILVSASDQDQTLPQLTSLRAIAPTVVIDDSVADWIRITDTVGDITGRESAARAAVRRYQDRLTEVKDRITGPDHPVGCVEVAADGETVRILTADSGQGRILSDLGWQIDQPDSAAVTLSTGIRPGVLTVTDGDLSDALTSATVLAVVDGQSATSALSTAPVLGTLTAAADDRVFTLDSDVARIDFFSALSLLAQIEALFAT